MASGNEWPIANQQRSRDANERMQTLVVGLVATGEAIPFICECADADCFGEVTMSSAEYDDIHSDRDRYAIAHDHNVAEGEELVERRRYFDVVSKVGLSGSDSARPD